MKLMTKIKTVCVFIVRKHITYPKKYKTGFNVLYARWSHDKCAKRSTLFFVFRNYNGDDEDD